jgi:peptidoglycan/xylan/chitin deacetylase (PgdA/CDA1 family)
MIDHAETAYMKSTKSRLRGTRRSLRALTIWHPYMRAYSNPRWWRRLLRAAFVRAEIEKRGPPQEAISLIFTCDLELDPPWEGGSWDQRGLRGVIEGLPRLLNLLEAREIRGTFFTEGILARLSPESVLEVARRGHEVGCHGLAHESYGGSYRIDETIPRPPTLQGRRAKEATLRKAKEMLEELVGVPIRSFRAPFLYIDAESSTAMANAGFLVDSSLQNHLFGYLSAPTHLDPGKPLARSRDTVPRLIEVPMSVDPRPRLRSHHPYGSVEQGLRTRSVLERLIAASAVAGVAPTLVLLVHPWEFVEGFPSPFGQMRGTARTKRFEQFLDVVGEIAPVRSIPMGTIASEWEQSRCHWHADGELVESPRSLE